MPGAPPGVVIVAFVDVSVPSAGQVEVLFGYTFATSDIDLVVTTTACTDAADAYNDLCTVLGSDKALPTTSRSARVVFQLTAAATIRIWIYNFTSDDESGVLNVFLTR